MGTNFKIIQTETAHRLSNKNMDTFSDTWYTRIGEP